MYLPLETAISTTVTRIDNTTRGEQMKLKLRDYYLIANLRDDSRQTMKQLSGKTGIPVSTIFDKIRAYQDSVIQRRTVIVNFNDLGFHVRAHIALKVRNEERAELRDFLINHTHVNSLYRINNGFDFLLECIFEHMQDMERFVDLMENRFRIKTKEIRYIINDIKRETFMTNNQTIDMLLKSS